VLGLGLGSAFSVVIFLEKMDIKSTINLGNNGTFAVNNTFTVRLEDIATGKARLAFPYAAFLVNACKILETSMCDSKYGTMAKQFEFINMCSIYRNNRLFDTHNQKPVRNCVQTLILVLLPFIAVFAPISIAIAFIACALAFTSKKNVSVPLAVEKAAAMLCIDITKYIDTTDDDAEIDGFKTAGFCDVQDSVSLVNIIIDKDQIPHLFVIVQKTLHGINQLSLPYKISEKNVKTTREEDTLYAITGAVTTYYELDTVDPRPRMSKHDGILRVDKITDI